MVDPISAARLGYRSLYLLLAAVLLFVHLLPLSTLPPDWVGPDMLLCLSIVWLLRRPDYVPLLTLAAVFFVEDLLVMRPPGLWTLVVIAGTEFLRSREVMLRELPFPAEWAVAGVVMGTLMAAHQLLLNLFMIPNAGIGPVAQQALSTVAAYPIVALLTHYLFGLRRAATGEVDALGHRL